MDFKKGKKNMEIVIVVVVTLILIYALIRLVAEMSGGK